MIEVVVRGNRYYRIAGGDLFARRSRRYLVGGYRLDLHVNTSSAR